MPTISETVIYSESKDHMLWGRASAPPANNYAGADDEVYPFGGNTIWAGQIYSESKFTSPPEVWDRYRGFLAFNTSGYKLNGWVRNVKLKLWLTNCWAAKNDANLASPINYFDEDWVVQILTVSGANYRNVSYSSSYGFGDSVGGTYEAINDWGLTQVSPDLISLTEVVKEISYLSIADQAPSSSNKIISPGDTYPYKLNSFQVEIDIPLEFINPIGETHLKIVNKNEYLNIQPGDPTINEVATQYFQFGSREQALSARRPQLVLNYVTPDSYRMSNLRETDLSIHKRLQYVFDNSAIASGTNILDGYPDDMVNFAPSRNVSLEHVITLEDPVEIGNAEGESRRVFAVDVVCDKRGELDDILDIITEGIKGGVSYYDFRYGFYNPPPIGKIGISEIEAIHIEPLVLNDVRKFHSIITFTTSYLRSGI